MTINFDQAKHEQAIGIIAKEIAKLPANELMEHGTHRGKQGYTKREGEARSMARWFIEHVDKITVDFGKAITPETKENAILGEIHAEVARMANAAIAVAGK